MSHVHKHLPALQGSFWTSWVDHGPCLNEGLEASVESRSSTIGRRNANLRGRKNSRSLLRKHMLLRLRMPRPSNRASACNPARNCHDSLFCEPTARHSVASRLFRQAAVRLRALDFTKMSTRVQLSCNKDDN